MQVVLLFASSLIQLSHHLMLSFSFRLPNYRHIILPYFTLSIHLTRHNPGGHSGRYGGFPLTDVGEEGEEQAIPSHGKDDTG